MKVFIKVPVSKELPENGNHVFVSTNDIKTAIGKRIEGGWEITYADGTDELKGEDYVDWWLKEVEIIDDKNVDNFIVTEYGFYNNDVTTGMKVGMKLILDKLK